jgi:hypothetical protein
MKLAQNDIKKQMKRLSHFESNQLREINQQ